jgi:chromosome segregation ATPase
LTRPRAASALFGEGPDFFARLSEVRDAADAQAARLRAKGRTARDARAQLRADTDRQIADLTADCARLADGLDEAQRALDEAEAAAKRTKGELRTAKAQVRELETAAADSEQSLKVDHERSLDSVHSDNTQLQRRLNEHIERLSAELLATSEAAAAHEATVARLQKLTAANARTIAEKTDEIAALEKRRAADAAQAAAQSEKEKENLVQAYETALAELREQCGAQQRPREGRPRAHRSR